MSPSITNLALPSDFMDAIRNIAAYELPPLASKYFRYEMTKEVTIYNDQVLDHRGHNITRVIAARPNTEISYGVEFRSLSTL